MNKRFRCVIAGWLLLMLCACTGGTDEPHIRYYRLASRAERKLPRQSGVSALLRHGAQGNGRRDTNSAEL